MIDAIAAEADRAREAEAGRHRIDEGRISEMRRVAGGTGESARGSRVPGLSTCTCISTNQVDPIGKALKLQQSLAEGGGTTFLTAAQPTPLYRHGIEFDRRGRDEAHRSTILAYGVVCSGAVGDMTGWGSGRCWFQGVMAFRVPDSRADEKTRGTA